MSQVYSVENHLAIFEGGVDPEAGQLIGASNSAAPLVIGLVLPILLFLLIDPLALLHAPFILSTILFPMLLFSVAVYTYCVFDPGAVVGVVADGASRALEVVQANFFATRRTRIERDDIVSLQLGPAFDKYGVVEPQAILVLQSGQHIGLPVVTTAREVDALKSVVGLK